jgi:GT2 family glycosyltransferase
MNDNSPVKSHGDRDSGPETLPTICVAICTRNRPEQLRRALHSLLEQTQPPAEILVVDNAPSDEKTKTIVINEFSEVRYVEEPVQGLNFARNRALVETSKEIVAFVDDDAVAEPSWVENIQKVFLQYPRAGVCTGKISPYALETPAQILFENNGGLMASHRVLLRIPTEASHHGWKWRHMPSIAWAASLGVGCNLSVRRKLALQIGGFDEALDFGLEMPGGGDQDMVWRMLDSGAEVIYQPLAGVRHEHRRELTAVHEQIMHHQIGLIGLVTKAVQLSGGSKRIGAVAFLSWRLMKPGVRLLRRAFGRDTLPCPLLLRIWWHSWRSLGAYSTAQKVANQRASHARMSTCQ